MEKKLEFFEQQVREFHVFYDILPIFLKNKGN